MQCIRTLTDIPRFSPVWFNGSDEGEDKEGEDKVYIACCTSDGQAKIYSASTPMSKTTRFNEDRNDTSPIIPNGNNSNFQCTTLDWSRVLREFMQVTHSKTYLVTPHRAINRDRLRGPQFKGPKSRESSHLSLFEREGAFRSGRAVLAIARASGKRFVSRGQRASQPRSIRRQCWHKQTPVSCNRGRILAVCAGKYAIAFKNAPYSL